MTLNDLSMEFAVNYMATRLRPATIRGYSVNLRRHILPYLGTRPVDGVTVNDLDILTDTLKKSGLANKTSLYVHATLRKMLNYATRRGYVTKNPYAAFDLPRADTFHYVTLTGEQSGRLLQAVKGTSIEIPVILALCYGLRRGECLGVKPSADLDPVGNTLHIQRTRSMERGRECVTPCKTAKGNRLLLLSPEHTSMLAAIPAGHYACPLSVSTLDTRFSALLKSAKLPKIRFHDLRHTYATLMLQGGINPKIVSTVLGHSGVSVTLDIYSHPQVNMQSVCLDMFHKITGVSVAL